MTTHHPIDPDGTRSAEAPMVSTSLRPSQLGHFARNYVEWLTFGVVIFIFQTGLVPFDFSSGPGVVGSFAMFIRTTSHLTYSDIVANIFLYVPLGVFTYWSMERQSKKPSRLACVLVTLGFGALISGGIEWVQAYSPVRVSSLIDFVSNTLGTGVGILLSCVGRWFLVRIVKTATLEFRTRPHASLVKAYALLLVVFAALPFSLSLDVGRLKQAAKASVFVPFGTSITQQSKEAHADTNNDYMSKAYVRWDGMKRWSRWVAECASFAVLAWLIQVVLVGDYRFAERQSVFLTFWLGGWLAVGLSILQLPIVSRSCDVTDIIFRVVGLLVGTIAAIGWAPKKGQLDDRQLGLESQKVVRLAYYGVFFYIIYTGLLPFSFEGEGSDVARVTPGGFLPFFAYFVARFDIMMDDAMEKFATYALLAALLAAGWSRRYGAMRRSGLTAILVTGVGLSVVIEIVQAFMPVRVTSLTDPILAAAGCLVGAVGQEHLARFYHLARSSAIGVAAPAGPGSPAPTPLAIDDALASLMDERPDAPVEPSPGPARARPRKR